MKNRQLKIFFSILFVFAVGFYAGANFQSNNQNPSGYKSDSKDLDLSEFWEVWGMLQTKYVDASNIDKQAAVYGSIKGLVESLGDPYSTFLDPSETEIFTSDLDNELEGIGAELTVQDGELVVIQPLKASPAELAGLKRNDVILEINGQDASEMTFIDAIKNIRGKEGTEVTLTIFRPDTNKTFPVTIVRGQIEVPSVTTEELEDGIFYISINQFSNDTEKEFYEAVRQALLFNAKSLILDLRSNGGGYLDSSVEILGEFIEPDKVAVIVESEAARTRDVIKTDGSARLSDIPMVVLINEDSASASEILAGALQDHKRATIIGVTSYGKGTVQEVVRLGDKASLRLTIAKWLTPNERDIDGEGIAPDIEVKIVLEEGEEPVSTDKDIQLEKAKEFLKSL